MSYFPIRCFQCRAVTGNKWEIFWKLTGVSFDKKGKMIWNEEARLMSDDHALDEMGIMKPCCRVVLKTCIQYN